MSAPPERFGVGDLLDINVWPVLSDADHAHHPAAQRFWAETSHINILWCRHTAGGFKRLICRPALMGDKALTPPQGFDAYQKIRQQARVKLQADPDNLELVWRQLAEKAPWPPRLWSAAYLAALAVLATAANLRLVSFNRDFSRFPGLNWLHLPKETA